MLSVTIETGNDAMQTSDDVADALRELADRVAGGYESGAIIDNNGNTVGSWTLDLDTEDEGD